MSDRTRLEKAVLTAALMGVGFGLTWLAAALGIGVFIGKAAKQADDAEEARLARLAAEPQPLLGVVTPRQPVA